MRSLGPARAARAQGAEEMNRMEHLLNVYAAKNARGAVAEFLGYCEVARTEASAKLTEGVWLVRRERPRAVGSGRRHAPGGCTGMGAARFGRD
jgi:hypothetical protein